MSTPAIIDTSIEWNDRIESTKALEELGSPFLGVAPRRYNTTSEPGELNTPYVGVECCDSSVILGYPANPSNGGANFDTASAYHSGIAETIERYCAAYVAERDLHANPALPKLLPANGRPFSSLQYSRPNFPFVPVENQANLSWTEAYDPLSGKTFRVPSYAVFLRDLSPFEGRFDYTTSNGLAAGPSREEAFLSGVLELIERDAIMRSWENRWTPPKFDLYSNRTIRKFIERQASRTHLEFHVLDMTELTVVPTAMGVVIDRRNSEWRMGTGGKSSWSAENAVQGALFEAFHCLGYSRNNIDDRGIFPDPIDLSRQKVIDLEDHVRFYATRKAVESASWLLSSEKFTPIASSDAEKTRTPGDILMDILGRLRQQGIQCAGVDVTSPDIIETPIRVVRTISEQLVPLTVGYGMTHDGYERLGSIPQRQLGRKNPYPHPFP